MEDQRLVELKITADEGETWYKREINMINLNESGLNPGEIFQFGGEQFKVFAGDDGLRVQKLKKQIVRIKTVNRFKN